MPTQVVNISYLDVLEKAWPIILFVMTASWTVALLFFRVKRIEEERGIEKTEKAAHKEEVAEDLKGVSGKINNVKTDIDKQLTEQNRIMGANHLDLSKQLSKLEGWLERDRLGRSEKAL